MSASQYSETREILASEILADRVSTRFADLRIRRAAEQTIVSVEDGQIKLVVNHDPDSRMPMGSRTFLCPAHARAVAALLVAAAEQVEASAPAEAPGA